MSGMPRRTALDVGVGNTTAALRRLCGNAHTAVVFDPRDPELPAVDVLRRPVAIPVESGTEGVDLDALAARLRATEPAVIVAIGDRATLDAAKLAALVCTDESLWAAARAGWSRHPVTNLPAATASVPFVAVPSEPGTCAEVGGYAMVSTTQGTRFVVGDALRPAHAILDGQTFLPLPVATLRVACFAALVRIAGAASGRQQASAASVALADALVIAGGGPLHTARERLRVASLGAAYDPSQGVADLFAGKHAPLATEVAFALGTRSAEATAAVVASVWRRIDAGDERWGRRDGLRSLWDAVAASADLPTAPGHGITALMSRWGIDGPPRPDDESIEGIAAATEFAWGHATPVLRGIARAEIADVLRAGAWR